jgi:hypothetical protein
MTGIIASLMGCNFWSMSMEHFCEIGIGGKKGVQSVELGETPVELSGKTILAITMSLN